MKLIQNTKVNFKKIIEYGEMKPIYIKQEENKYFENIIQKFGNSNETLRFLKELQEDISYQNVIQRINTKKEFNINGHLKEATFKVSCFHSSKIYSSQANWSKLAW